MDSEKTEILSATPTESAGTNPPVFPEDVPDTPPKVITKSQSDTLSSSPSKEFDEKSRQANHNLQPAPESGCVQPTREPDLGQPCLEADFLQSTLENTSLQPHSDADYMNPSQEACSFGPSYQIEFTQSVRDHNENHLHYSHLTPDDNSLLRNQGTCPSVMSDLSSEQSECSYDLPVETERRLDPHVDNLVAKIEEVSNDLKISSVTKDWLICNITSMESLDELENCESLTIKQLKSLKNCLSELFLRFTSFRQHQRGLSAILCTIGVYAESDLHKDILHWDSSSTLQEFVFTNKNLSEDQKREIWAFCGFDLNFLISPTHGNVDNSLLDAMNYVKVSDESRSWLIENYQSFKSPDDLDDCESLTMLQLKSLKSALKVLLGKEVEPGTTMSESKRMFAEVCGVSNQDLLSSLELAHSKGDLAEFLLSDLTLPENQRLHIFCTFIQEDTNIFGPLLKRAIGRSKFIKSFADALKEAGVEENLEQLLESIDAFDSLEDILSQCDDLTVKQMKYMKSNFGDQFNEFVTSRKEFGDKMIIEHLNVSELEGVGFLHLQLLYAASVDHLSDYLEHCEQLSDAQRQFLFKLYIDNNNKEIPMEIEEPVDPLELLNNSFMAEAIEILDAAKVSEETKNWIVDRLPSMESVEELEECESLTMKQFIILKKTLGCSLEAYIGAKMSLSHNNIASPSTRLEILKNRVAASDIPDDAKNWIFENSSKLASVAELGACDYLSEYQVRTMKTKLFDLIPLHMSESNSADTRNVVKHPFYQKLGSVLDHLEVTNEAKEWLNEKIDQMASLKEVNSCEHLTHYQCTQITDVLGPDFLEMKHPPTTEAGSRVPTKFVHPLVICRIANQDGLAVEKFAISVPSLKKLCNSFPDGTPRLIHDSTNGFVINFEKLDDLKLELVGLFGKFSHVLAFLQKCKVVSDVKIRQCRDTCLEKGTGLYIVHCDSFYEPDMSSKVFLFFYSKDDDDYKNVRQKSRAVHFLRYLTQLTTNIVILLEDSDLKMLSSKTQKRSEQCKRRVKYTLQQHELQKEGCSVKTVGQLCLTTAEPNCQVYASNTEGLIEVVKQKKLKTSRTETYAKIVSFETFLKDYNKKKFADKVQLTSFFKDSLLKYVSPEVMVDIQEKTEELRKNLQKDKAAFIEILNLSISLYCLRKVSQLEAEALDRYLSSCQDPDSPLNWDRIIKFNDTTINHVVSYSEEMKLLAGMRKVEKSLEFICCFLRMQLSKTDAETDGKSFKELLKLASKKDIFAKHSSWLSFSYTDHLVEDEFKKWMKTHDFSVESSDLQECAERVLKFAQEFAAEKDFEKMSIYSAGCKQKFEQHIKDECSCFKRNMIDEKFASAIRNRDADIIDSAGEISKIECHDFGNDRYTIWSSSETHEEEKFECSVNKLIPAKDEVERLAQINEEIRTTNIKLCQAGKFIMTANEEILYAYPVAENCVLLVINIGRAASKCRIVNLLRNQNQSEIPFGKPVSRCDFDSKTRVLCLFSDQDSSVLNLYKFGADYKTHSHMKKLDLKSQYDVESASKFCLQYHSKYLWFLDQGRLRKIDIKNGSLAGNAKIDSLRGVEFDSIQMTPNGTCMLLHDIDGNTYPVMTESGTLLSILDTGLKNHFLFTIADRIVALRKTKDRFLDLSEIVITGAQHELKLVSSAAAAKQNHEIDVKDEGIHWLNYFYWMFTKFPCVDILADGNLLPLTLCFFTSQSDKITQTHTDVQALLGSVLMGLRDRLHLTRKPIDQFQLDEKPFVSAFAMEVLASFNGKECRNTMGAFVQSLISFIPLQVARCQSNEFYVLEDGQPMACDGIQDAFDMTSKISLGLFESIFNWWQGPVKVVSSMGKQSTGKSFTLNHLTGSSFNISGARCTDGCWMTVKVQHDCLYVILDFEGLGSFERSKQEDMLLSLFNSAMSTMTIFKTEYRLDRDVDQMFSKFNLASDTLKGTDNIFQGTFMIVVKDVAVHDIEDVQKEFAEKINGIISKEKDNNFISKLYRGGFEIHPFPAFESDDYYQDMNVLCSIMKDEIKPVFVGGSFFMSTLKFLLAKLAISDFTPLSRQQVDSRIKYLRQVLPYAIRYGQISPELPKKPEFDLKVLDDVYAEVPTVKIVHVNEFLGNITFDDKDFVYDEENLAQIVVSFSKLLSQDPINFLQWREDLERYLDAGVTLRCERVEKWLKENTKKWESTNNSEFSDALATLMETFANHMFNLKQQMKFCNEKCQHCFLKCTQIMNHKYEHCCSTGHRCLATCEFCTDQISDCKLKFGHEDRHICKDANHVCGLPCKFNGINGCENECQQLFNHEGDHACTTKLHLCSGECSLPSCSGKCQISCELEHTVHKCSKEECVHQCCIETCSNKCSALDHFHGTSVSKEFRDEQGLSDEPPFLLNDGVTRQSSERHFCGQEHQCDQLCGSDGYCNVIVEKEVENLIFKGARDEFKYNLKFVQKSERRFCRQKIREFETFHEGGHNCSNDVSKVHQCTNTCPTCENICDKPFGHSYEGDVLHHTSHGNMRNCFFIANEEDIEVGDHKYKVGEPAVAELCHIFCNSMGRGHIHVVECDAGNPKECIYSDVDDFRRHETCKYQPNEEVPKDEILHSAYWNTIGFQDPCQEATAETFECCPYYCSAEDHEKQDTPSHCVLDVWHPPVRSLADVSMMTGTVTKEGHVFSCVHPSASYHFVLALDDSGSMSGRPWQELVDAVKAFISSRLSMTSDDKLSVMLHNSTTRIEAEYINFPEFNADTMLNFRSGGNSFSVALNTVDQIISRHLNKSICPVLVFMSDGIWHDGEVEMERLTTKYKADYGFICYTLGFGSVNFAKLRELARVGKGQFVECTQGIDLKNAFVDIAAKHPPTISVSSLK